MRVKLEGETKGWERNSRPSGALVAATEKADSLPSSPTKFTLLRRSTSAQLVMFKTVRRCLPLVVIAASKPACTITVSSTFTATGRDAKMALANPPGRNATARHY